MTFFMCDIDTAKIYVHFFLDRLHSAGSFIKVLMI